MHESTTNPRSVERHDDERASADSRRGPVETGAMHAPSDPLVIAGRAFRSRLLVGTGKFSSPRVMREAMVASGARS